MQSSWVKKIYAVTTCNFLLTDLLFVILYSCSRNLVWQTIIVNVNSVVLLSGFFDTKYDIEVAVLIILFLRYALFW